jgi:Fur family ferric uptake transcriptional regulator
MIDGSHVFTALQDNGHRLTEPRRDVIRLISGRVGHFTSADLLADARVQELGVGRATVFRTLDALSEVGVIERIDLPTGEHAYVACTPVHHHHVVCSSCGRSDDVDDAGVRSVVRDVARRTGFRVDVHRLELFGLCPDCQREIIDGVTA